MPAIVTDADHKLKKDVTDILNKLTPSNFEKLCERFLALEINTVDRMVMCVQLLPLALQLFSPLNPHT